MPTLYDLAVMLVRLFGAINLVAGISAWLGVVAIVWIDLATHHASGDVGVAVVAYLAEYGAACFLLGIGLIISSKLVARYAAAAR